MNAPPSQIIAALDVLERRLKTFNLIKSGAVTKESEARHLLDMVREARLYIEDSDTRN